MSDSSFGSPAEIRLTLVHSRGAQPRKVARQLEDGRVVATYDTPDGEFKSLYWRREVVSVPHDIDALADAIRRIAAVPTACFVLGEPIGEVTPDESVQRCHVDQDGRFTSLRTRSVSFLPIDVDKATVEGFPLNPRDPAPSIAAFVEQLGAPFTGAQYIWQLTSSASPDSERVSARLFFLLDRDVPIEELKRWADRMVWDNGASLVDFHIYSASQMIFTAAPLFTEGRDPFPERIGVCYDGDERLDWSAVSIPAEDAVPAYKGSPSICGGRGVERFLSLIGDHPGGKHFHDPILRAIGSMAWQGWTFERVCDVIRERVLAAVRDPALHSESDVLRYLSDRWLRGAYSGALAKRVHETYPPRPTLTRRAADALSLDDAGVFIFEKVLAWLRGEGPEILVLCVTVGGGKTYQTIKACLQWLLEDEDAHLVWAVPEHDLGAEAVEAFGSDIAIRIEGRVRWDDAGDRIGVPKCRTPEVIEKIKDRKLLRFTREIACGVPGQDDSCRFLNACPYYGQFRGHRVRVVPHATLQHAGARALSGAFKDCPVVIDESPLGSMLGHGSHPLSEVIGDAGALRDAVLAIRDGTEVDVDDLVARLDDLLNDKPELPDVGPRDTWALLSQLESLRPARSYAGLILALQANLRGGFNTVWFSDDRVYWSGARDLIRGRRALVLDAGNGELYREMWGDKAEVVTVDIFQNRVGYQITDAPLGKGALADDDTLAQACAVSMMFEAGSGGSGTGATFLPKEARFRAIGMGWLSEWRSGHYGRERGINAHIEASSMCVIGRPEPKPLELEAMARGLFHSRALELTGSFSHHMDGDLAVRAHSDRLCDLVLRSVREESVRQADGRDRACRSDVPKPALYLTTTPTPHVTHKVRWADIAPDATFARLLLSGGGVAPMLPRWLVGRGWHQNEVAARRWVSRVCAWCQDLIVTDPLLGVISKGLVTIKIRIDGRRGPASSVITLLSVDQARDRLERLLGSPVAIRADEETGELSFLVTPRTAPIEPDISVDPVAAQDDCEPLHPPEDAVPEMPPEIAAWHAEGGEYG